MEHSGQQRPTARPTATVLVADVVRDVIRRRLSGEVLSDEMVLREHPDLEPELREKLADLRWVEQARAVPGETISVPGRASSRRDDLHPSIDVIPGYELGVEISRGGQGIVYRAIQKSTRREVAIKLTREGPFSSAADRIRFEREVHILAQLNHPNIVTIFDSGVAADHFYYAMRLIEGHSVTDWLERNPRGVRQTLELFARICDAVTAAHLRGVIHRDLKPSNIQVDAGGEPYVLDFGLAKLAEDGELLTVSSDRTQTGQFVGSLPWAAPEQAEGRPPDIDIRTDVYALGVVLYQMLTGRFPYVVQGAMRDVLDNIVHAEPCRPRLFRKEIDAEVAIIVLKCLSKEREHRYQSVIELATDIRRYLRHEAILAHPPKASYLFRKFVRQHRWPVAFSGTVVLLLAAFGVVSVVQALRLREQRNAAVVAGRIADEKAAEARSEQAIAERKTLEAAEHAAEAERQLMNAEWQAYLANIAAADAAVRAGDGMAARRRLDRVPHRLHNWERWHLGRRVDGNPAAPAERVLSTASEARESVRAVALSPDGTRLACGRGDGVVTLLTTRAGTELSSSRGHIGAVRGVAYSPDGRLVATCGEDGAVRLWNSATGALAAQRLPEGGHATCIAFAPTGTALAYGDDDGGIRLWDREASSERAAPVRQSRPVTAIQFCPDGRWLVAGTSDGMLALYDGETLVEKSSLRAHLEPVAALAVSPNGALLACGSDDRRISVWEVEGLQKRFDLEGHEARISGLSFTPDGTRLASCSGDGTVKLWRAPNWEEVLTLRGLGGPVDAVVWSPDQARLISAAAEGVHSWEGPLAAEDLIAQMFSDLMSWAEVVASLEADDAIDPHRRRVALMIARSRRDDPNALETEARRLLLPHTLSGDHER